jgi:imidazolonepropionase-like amidohydrolase
MSSTSPRAASCAEEVAVRVAIHHAHVVVGNGETLDDAIVVVDGDRIESVGDHRDADRPYDLEVDLEGRTLIPGLIDCHIHMVGGDKTLGFDGEPPIIRTDQYAVTKALLEGVAAARTTLRSGFTTVREVGGRDYHDVALKRAQRAGLVEGPRLLASGPGVWPTGGSGAHLEPNVGVDGEVDARRRVRELVERGADVIKIVSADGPPGVDPGATVYPTEDEVRAIFGEATRLGKVKAAHAMAPEAIDVVVRAGTDTVEHAWYMSEENCNTLLQSDAYLVGTLSNAWAMVNHGREVGFPWTPMMERDLPDIQARYRMAIEMGVKIAAGTDVGGNPTHWYGESARELEAYVECGMTPLDAIASGTMVAACAIGLDSSVGSVEPGKLADLVVVDGDPLADISLTRSGVVAVMQGGTIFRDDLGLFLASRAHVDDSQAVVQR